MKPFETESILRLLAGEVSAAELAAHHGVTVEEIERWKAAWIAGARSAQQPRRRSPTTWLVASVLVLGAVAFGSRAAWAAGCASTLPSPLVTFCPNDPALASQVNGNFQALVDGLQQKVGTFGTQTITAPGPVTVQTTLTTTALTASASANLTGATLNGSTIVPGVMTVSGIENVSGTLNVTGTLDVSPTTVTCTNGQPCYCPVGLFPLTWTGTCANAGHAVYSVLPVTNASGARGYEVKCLLLSNNQTYNMLNLSVLCTRLRVP